MGGKNLFFAAIMLSNISVADGKVQMARFEKYLKILEAPMGSSKSPKKVADKLLVGQSRVAAFYLQALGKLYQKEDRSFRELRHTFKDLEDGIGEYHKWRDLYEAAKKQKIPKAKKTSIRKKREKAKTELVDLLEEAQWVTKKGESKLAQTRSFLKDYHWKAYAEDKSYRIDALVSQIEKVHGVDYDLRYLEQGNGLHELRREIRWFLIQARALNGLIYFKKASSCPIKAYRKLPFQPIAKSKYGRLPKPTTEPDPCYISQCLFLAAVDAVNELGKLKDEAEKRLNVNSENEDMVPEDLKKKAEAILSQLEKNNLFPKIISELKACKT